MDALLEKTITHHLCLTLNGTQRVIANMPLLDRWKLCWQLKCSDFDQLAAEIHKRAEGQRQANAVVRNMQQLRQRDDKGRYVSTG